MQLSNELVSVLILAIMIVARVVFKRYFGKSLPGPIGLPFVGYLPFLGKAPHKKLRELSKKYGSIFSVNIVSTNYVIVSDYETTKEILNHPSTYARPNSFLQILPGNGGFGTMGGQEWIKEKRHCFSMMKTLGLGKGLWETLIQKEAEEFVQEIRTWKGKPRDFAGPMTKFITSSSMALLIGRKLKKTDSIDEEKILEDVGVSVVKYLGIISLSATVPMSILKLLCALRIGEYRHLMNVMDAFGNIFKNEINSRLESKDHRNEDFITHYLKELEDSKGDKNSTLSLNNLIGDMAVMFIAGNDTTQSSLQWLLLIIASYSEVQKKIQREIDEKIGPDRQIYWDNRTLLPYTMATIWEMERWASVNPLYPPREVIESFECKGHTIPKGSAILCNSWAIANDPKYHKDPEIYRPERFLVDDGKLISQIESNLPFSTGRRDCPGKNVAMMTIFLYFTALVQKFDITTVDGKPANFERIFGIVSYPTRQLLRFTER